MSGPEDRALKAGATVALDMERRIVRRDYVDGELLPAETDLVSSYGVSRAVLREAMRLLETDGLVRIRRGQGGGARVSGPDPATAARYVALVLQHEATTLTDLDSAVFAVEAETVWLLASTRPAEGIAHLQDVLATTDITEPGSMTDFHGAIASATGNRILAGLSDVLREVRARHARAAVRPTADRDWVERDLATAHAFHGRLLGVAAGGEADRARGQWQRHCRVAARALAHDPATTVLDLFPSRYGEAGSLSPDGALRPARLPKGADIIASEIRRRIVTGELREGDALPTEVELMEQYGLSRSPVREAVRVLEAQRLVRPRRGSHHGSLVSSPSLEVAARQFGVLMEYQGATVGELVQAQQLVARAAAELLRPASVARVLPESAALSFEPDRLETLAALNRMQSSVVAAPGNVSLPSLYRLVTDLLGREVARAGRSRRRSTAAGAVLADAHERFVASVAAPDLEGMRSSWLRLCDAMAAWTASLLEVDRIVTVFD